MIEFIDLASQQTRIRDKLQARIGDVLAHGKYIMGPEVAELELRLAEFSRAQHVISCANGTDALLLMLLALGVGRKDAVFVPSFTFASTAEVVPHVGATPFFVDVRPDTYNICANSLERSLNAAVSQGLNPKLIIAVDLFGLPADYDAIKKVAEKYAVAVAADSAQAWGASIGEVKTGRLAEVTTTSFFPAKPLGCYGDGGAIATNDTDLAQTLKSLRVHGKGTHKYDNVAVGLNSRLDTLQAAILLEKLAIYPDEIRARHAIADRYTKELGHHYQTPVIPHGYQSVYAQYSIRAKSESDRSNLMSALKEKGIPTQIYYPVPLHKQTAYREFPRDPAGLASSEALANTIFSLPVHPYLKSDQQEKIIEALIIQAARET